MLETGIGLIVRLPTKVNIRQQLQWRLLDRRLIILVAGVFMVLIVFCPTVTFVAFKVYLYVMLAMLRGTPECLSIGHENTNFSRIKTE